MNEFQQDELLQLKNEFGDISFEKFFSIINTIKNGILIDIGVYEGASSKMMIKNAILNNNKIYAIDPIPGFSSNNPNYEFLKDDSVLIGQYWKHGKVDLVFFDSVHAKEQVLGELYYWWDIIKVGGYAIFHDTSWEGYIHKKGHSCEGKLTGNTAKGYDSFGGINWETPDKAIEEFFKVRINTSDRNINNNVFISNFIDEYIEVETNYADLGMTIIKKKQNYDYKNNLNNWDYIFNRRNILLSFFKTEEKVPQVSSIKKLFTSLFK